MDPDSRPLAAARTEADIAELKPDAVRVMVGVPEASVIRQAFRYCPEEQTFITLMAGERVNRDFLNRLEERVRQLSADAAGVIAGGAGTGGRLPPRGPVAWRTDKALPLLDELLCGDYPLGRYLFTELYGKLSLAYQWTAIDAEGLQPASGRPPKWRHAEAEWAAIQPLALCDPPLWRLADGTARGKQPASASGAGTEPYFTIALCTYNDAFYLPCAIRSVIRQTFPRWELIIVDDGSNDGTETLLQAWSGHPQIRVIRKESNRGKTDGLNTVLAGARGSWIVELDADDWLTPDCLEALYFHLSGNEKIGCLIGGYHEWMELSDKQLVYRRPVNPPSSTELPGWLAEGRPAAPRCYSAASLQEIGGWKADDPSQGRLYEDIVMLERLNRLGIVHELAVPLYHRRLRPASVTNRQTHYFVQWARSRLPDSRR